MFNYNYVDVLEAVRCVLASAPEAASTPNAELLELLDRLPNDDNEVNVTEVLCTISYRPNRDFISFITSPLKKQ